MIEGIRTSRLSIQDSLSSAWDISLPKGSSEYLLLIPNRSFLHPFPRRLAGSSFALMVWCGGRQRRAVNQSDEEMNARDLIPQSYTPLVDACEDDSSVSSAVVAAIVGGVCLPPFLSL